MRSLFSALWLALWGAASDPIARHELARWRAAHVRRTLRIGMAALTLVGAGGATLLAAVPPPYLLMQSPWAGTALGTIYFLLAGQDVLRLVAHVAAAALAGWAISADIESRMMPVLGATPVSGSRIAGAKLGAALHEARWLVVAATAIRLLLGGLAWIKPEFPNSLWVPVASVTLGNFPPPVLRSVIPFSSMSYDALAGTLSRLAMMRTAGIGIPWLAYYVLQPGLDALLFASAGMLVASAARTRSAGLGASLGAVVGLLFGGYLGERALSIVLTWLIPQAGLGPPIVPLIPAWTFGLPAAESGFLAAPGFAGWLVGPIMAGKLIALGMLLNAARRRVGRLPQVSA